MATLLNGSSDGRDLPAVLAAVLPNGQKFGIYHLSTPPIRTEALCSAPPDAHPDKTFVENHFLAVSIDSKQERTDKRDATAPGPGSTESEAVVDGADASYSQVLVLAIEVFIYTTAHTTTFFISKADSTGYLALLKLPAGTPSPIREVCGAFVSFLVANRRRRGLQCIVSLFARAQNQYLFPGSVENRGKHVLDDRGLVRWWCRVLDLVVQREQEPVKQKKHWDSVRGYLVVPGLDHYETRASLPRHPPSTGAVSPHWTLGHPTRLISHYCRDYDWVPPRCLVPRYPDDPKSRFRDELDAEAERDKTRRLKETGSWKSVRTVDEFWDMMAFRQECSSGRLTGFLWVVLDPVKDEGQRHLDANGINDTHGNGRAAAGDSSAAQIPTPAASFDSSSLSLSQLPPSTPPKRLARAVNTSTPSSSGSASGEFPAGPSPTSPSPRMKHPDSQKKRTRPAPQLTGPIRPRNPLVKTTSRNYLLSRTPTSSAYYWWPADRPGRGQVVVDEAGYRRSVELLLRLDFATLPLAVGSTRRWTREVCTAAGAAEWQEKGKVTAMQRDEQQSSGWGIVVEGTREAKGAAPSGCGGAAAGGVNNLTGLVKRKRPAPDNAGDDSSASAGALNLNGSSSVGDGSGKRAPVTAAAAGVNVLGAGLVRKKKKTVD